MVVLGGQPPCVGRHVATVVVATARRLVARLPHTSTTATLHTATPVVAAVGRGKQRLHFLATQKRL